MIPMTADDLRAALVNGSKGDAKRATLPELDGVDWESLDYLGWQDAKRPRLHYVALELDGAPAVMILRGAENPPAKKVLCSWCEDVVEGIRAASFVAPLAGDSGRRGNTVGTMICADFRCSRNVRRAQLLRAAHRGPGAAGLPPRGEDRRTAGAVQRLRPRRAARLSRPSGPSGVSVQVDDGVGAVGARRDPARVVLVGAERPGTGPPR